MSFDGGQARSLDTVEIAIVSRATIQFIEIQDEEDVRRVPLTSGPLVLGTGRGVDVLIRDPTVSSRHCELLAHDGGVKVKDLGSRNGTYVGGARIHDGWVGSGEATTILIGHTTIVCASASEEEVEQPLGPPLPGIAGSSAVMRRLATQVRRLANLDAPVLIRGESGVGKELFARALHTEGARRDHPFIALNAATIPRELAETELFGHERGAFTGAVSKRLGAFAEAHGGTLFLDEIADLSLDAQPKLLRAVEGHEVRGVGMTGPGKRSDARIVTATHISLLERVEQGLFRKDLYHRIEVFVLEVPPLRERRGDVLPIAKALLERMGLDYGPRDLEQLAVAELTGHAWHGNVRELQATLMRAAVDAKARHCRSIDAAAVRRAIRRSALTPAIRELTPERAKHLMDVHQGNISAAARAANVPRTTFRKLLARAGGARIARDD
ncbi:MAG TPA: sigma 54-interacting transcriptional regulator [Labilithrix sp.]|nr:sigma 54-interacting transcriptional regulator [Labilithrix sp.]